jgi:hypothetical protein
LNLISPGYLIFPDSTGSLIYRLKQNFFWLIQPDSDFFEEPIPNGFPEQSVCCSFYYGFRFAEALVADYMPAGFCLNFCCTLCLEFELNQTFVR